MERGEVIAATAVLLFGAFCLGFIAHWAVSRIGRSSPSASQDHARLAEALRRAEDALDQAVAREASIEAQLRQVEADARETLDGLRAARREADDLRAWIDRQGVSRGAAP